YQTSGNAAIITSELVETVYRINNSPALWAIMNDTTLPSNIRATMVHIRAAAERLDRSAQLVEHMAAQTKNGKSMAGVLLADEEEAEKLRMAMADIYSAAARAQQLTTRLDSIAMVLQDGVNDKNGMAYTLLRDSMLAERLDSSLIHIQKGT